MLVYKNPVRYSYSLSQSGGKIHSGLIAYVLFIKKCFWRHTGMTRLHEWEETWAVHEQSSDLKFWKDVETLLGWMCISGGIGGLKKLKKCYPVVCFFVHCNWEWLTLLFIVLVLTYYFLACFFPNGFFLLSLSYLLQVLFNQFAFVKWKYSFSCLGNSLKSKHFMFSLHLISSSILLLKIKYKFYKIK